MVLQYNQRSHKGRSPPTLSEGTALSLINNITKLVRDDVALKGIRRYDALLYYTILPAVLVLGVSDVTRMNALFPMCADTRAQMHRNALWLHETGGSSALLYAYAMAPTAPIPCLDLLSLDYYNVTSRTEALR
jgi:hypothetical protein